MKKSIKKQKTEAEDHKLLWQRTLADFENYRKRIESEKAEWTNQAKAELIANLMPFFDNLTLMAHHTPEDLKENPWVKGVDLIASQIEKELESQGIVKIVPNLGDIFDPNLHEAISRETSNIEEDAIIRVQKPGFRIEEKVIRPAQVITSSGQK